MGYKGRDYSQFTYAPQIKKSPLEQALDTLTVVSLQVSKQKHEGKMLEKQLDYTRRTSEINRLGQIDPLTFPSDFGDPWNDPEDYLTYKTQVLNNTNMKRLGKEYKTDGVVLSKEAMNDIFTYGDESVTVEMTPTGLAMNDVLNFDAWLLGSGGKGREIAERHNWTGLLEKGNYDNDLGGYVLDELDYRDLQEKGLISNVDSVGGLYILNETQRNQVANNYNSWREGFLSNNTLPTNREVEKQIESENFRVLQARNQLRDMDELKPGFQAMDDWTIFTRDPNYGIATVDEKTNQVDKIKVRNPSGQVDNITYDKFVSDPYYSKLREFLSQDVEIAVGFWYGDQSLRNEFKLKAPEMAIEIQNSLDSYLRVKEEMNKIGVDQSQTDVLFDSKTQIEGRNIILDDLRTGAFMDNILFDDAKWDQMTQTQQDELINKLVQLEQSYSVYGSGNYDLNVVKFLELYGLNQGEDYAPGQAIIKLIQEIGNR